jgi:hypothetical protein
MTKEFQQELLEKVRPGTKPSDIKKQSQKQVKKPVLSSPMSISKSDEGYSSGEDKSIPKAPPLPNQQIKDLQAQVNSLQKQLQLYKDFRDSDLKIKEGYKENISKLQEQNKLLKEKLESKANPIAELQPEELKEPKLYLFTCSICDQNKKSQLHLAKINGLGIDPTKTQKLCDFCIKKVDIITPKEEFF